MPVSDAPPIVRTTPAEFHTELFWATRIDPIARAYGFKPVEAQMDPADRHNHVVKAPDGTVVVIVRTDGEPMCCPFHDRFPTSLTSCDEARINRNITGHREVYGP